MTSEYQFAFAANDGYPQLTDDAQTFPRSASKLSSELRRVHPILRRQGVMISRTREGKSGKRYIELKSARFDRQHRQYRQPHR